MNYYSLLKLNSPFENSTPFENKIDNFKFLNMNNQRIIRYDINFFYSQRFTNKKLPDEVLKALNTGTRINMKVDQSKLKIYEKTKNNFNKEELEKKINANLNKLSNDNFENIFAIIEVILKERQDILLDYTIKNLLNKAIMQPIFCDLYAKIYQKFYNKDTEKIFNNIFSELINVLEEKIISGNDKNYDSLCKYVKDKTRFIGLFNFISSLYKLKIVNIKQIYFYVDYLIKKVEENTEDVEKYCETLCSFLKKLENKNILTKYLELLKDLKTNSKYKFGMRYKFMLMDLFDLHQKM